MKTQISNLRAGFKNQILNPQIDYTKLSPSTSHIGHSGSNSVVVKQVWEKVVQENPDSLKAIIKGVEIDFNCNRSLSGKTVTYVGNISKEHLEQNFNLDIAQKQEPIIAIHYGNVIVVSNGKNGYRYVCPSFVKII